jgi:hypothetical protein
MIGWSRGAAARTASEKRNLSSSLTNSRVHYFEFHLFNSMMRFASMKESQAEYSSCLQAMIGA